jgi:hypothetical protein
VVETPTDRVPGVEFGAAPPGQQGPIYRIECRSATALTAASLLTIRAFLILPWVTVPHLASCLLGRMAHLLSQDWEHLYGHPVYFLETFVDPETVSRNLLRAANCVMLGATTGRGKNDQTNRPNRSIKEVLG